MAVLFSLSCSLNVSGSYPLPERFKSSYHCTWGLSFCNVSFGLQVKCVRIFYHQRSGVCTWKGRIIPVSRTIQPLIEHNPDRKSTRLNSSHVAISYAVFCL